MAKIRRNEPCVCGSGLKFKRCCGKHVGSPSPFRDAEHERAFQQARRKMEAERIQRENQQGLGKGIISAQLNDHRIVAVGNGVYFSKNWKTFQDFLREFLIDMLGRKWFRLESEKPDSDRHPIVRWYHQAIADSNRLSTKVGNLLVGPMTGAQRAFVNLAYNLYLIAHHADPGQLKPLFRVS